MERAPLDALVFEISGQRYALRASDVREIVRAVTVTPLPAAPAIVEGVINFRGRLAAVLDVRRRFRLPEKGLSHTDHFVVAQVGPRLVAVRADRALDLVRFDPARIDDAHPAVPGVGHVAGVVRSDDGLVLIHDLRTFLSETEASSLDGALAQAKEDAA